MLPDLSSALHFPAAVRRMDEGDEEEEVEEEVEGVYTTSTSSSSSVGEGVVMVRVDGMLVEELETMFALEEWLIGCCSMMMVMVSLVVVGLIATFWNSGMDARLL